ncbi:MAG: T9SS type A sorting domain-containing protein [Flavobacteriales bacterium]|nr:T9SS type A sorting domain-containing protein [Flavobacteriales bacterium]
MLFIVPRFADAQNLILNGSFEESDTCAVQLGFWPNGKPTHWEPVSETPDYFRSCVPYGSVNGVPLNTVGFQYPQEGGSYSGLFAYLVDDHREMIGSELLSPLTVGQTYYASFWVNAAYGGPQQTGSACNNIGMLFTMDMVPWVMGMPQITLRNHAHVYTQQVVSDTTGWTLVSGSFVADSAYRYVVIGNHFSNANTAVQVIGPGNPNKAYVYVDAACLSTDPEACPMWTSVQENLMEEISLWPNPASDRLLIGWGSMPVQRVSLLDALGRLVLDREVWGSNEVVLATREYPAGLYHVLLEGAGVKRSGKFVVVH